MFTGQINSGQRNGLSASGIQGVYLILAVLGFCTTAVGADTRPNIVLILADDLGYTDLGHYGSEINTPVLDRLAQSGVSFSNFHVAANCAPTRAMLMTGVNNHSVGVATIPEMVPRSMRDYPAYQGVLADNTVTIATMMKDQGYRTYLSGKWHLGSAPNKRPFNRGFDRTLMMADSGADNWEQRPYLTLYDKANWYRDGEETTLPGDFYSSELLVDTMIDFIESSGDNQPFFAYLPFLAVHLPVQAPEAFSAPYLTTYQDGWHVLRERRRLGAIKSGLIAADTPMADVATTRTWDDLSAAEKRYNAKRMAVYAGMVEAMDYHIGRLVESLKAAGKYDNTIFIFTSDNGAEASDLRNFMGRVNAFSLGYDQNYENLGLKGSLNSIGASFASAAVSPLSWYKFEVGEGGMRVPLIIAGPGIQRRTGFDDTFLWATDIVPTILSLSGLNQPNTPYKGKEIVPIEGRDFSPILRGGSKAPYGAADYIAYELAGSRVVFHQDYKLLYHGTPLGDKTWRLFNIKNDPGETKDIAADFPDRVARMEDAWFDFRTRVGIHDLPFGYDQTRQVTLNYLEKNYGSAWIGVLLVIPLAIILYVWRRKKKMGKQV